MERLRLLSELAAELALSTGDYESVLRLCAQRLSERFGDLCIIRLVSADGMFLEPSVALHGGDSDIADLARKITGTREPIDANAVLARVIESGRPALVPQLMNPETLAETSPERQSFVARLGITALVVAPLVSHGKSIGVASLVRRGGKSYDTHDLQLLQDIAAHAALAIETARTNHALAEASRAHQLLFEASPAPLCVYDTETLLPIAVNRAVLELFGMSKEEFMQKQVGTLGGLGADAVRRRLAEWGDREMSGITRHVRKDGTEMVAEFTSRSLEFAGRRARLTALKDVTARSQADATRAVLAAIVESSNDSIVSCAMDGTVITWNDAAQRLFGYTAHELIGKPFASLIPPDHLDKDAAAIDRVMRGELVGPEETKRRRRDGSLIHVAVSLAPIRNATGKVVAIARTTRDLTAQHEAADALARTEAHLRQAQKMEAIGRLAGGVAHDFNNMLAVILSYCSIIVEELAPGAPYRDEMLEIEHAATRAADLTRQLLVFSRQNVVEPRVVDLNALVQGMHKMLARVLGEDIEMSFLPAPDIGSIRVDPSNVDQVLLNLVVNARDAMPKGGSLVIKTREVVVAGQLFVALDVVDSGEGMDEAVQARIFEPFFTTKAIGKGTGLGLATVFGIAQQAGGDVHVTSAPGKGATFTVYFPRADADESKTSIAPVAAGARHATILLVEDEPLVRTVTARILRAAGYTVIVASCASDALRACAEHEGAIDLLLTDVVMPHMSGPELAERVREARHETKVMCMSGYTDNEGRAAVVASGVTLLQKPFTPHVLKTKVHEVLEGHVVH